MSHTETSTGVGEHTAASCPCSAKTSVTSWQELHAHLRAKYVLAREEPDWIGLIWRFTRDSVLIEQRVKIELATAFECAWIVVRSPICLAGDINAEGALRLNGRLSIGALVTFNDRCYLRATMPLGTLNLADLDRTLEFIARERPPGLQRLDQLERRGGRTCSTRGATTDNRTTKMASPV